MRELVEYKVGSATGTKWDLLMQGPVGEMCAVFDTQDPHDLEHVLQSLYKMDVAVVIEVDESGERTSVLVYHKGDVPAPRRQADRLLSRIEVWTPIKLREELIGDIREDVHHRREQGWTEKQLRRLIWWQFGYAIAGWVWGRIEQVMTLIRSVGK